MESEVGRSSAHGATAMQEPLQSQRGRAERSEAGRTYEGSPRIYSFCFKDFLVLLFYQDFYRIS